MNTEWVSIATVAWLYDVSNSTIRRWISRGLIRTAGFGRNVIRVDLNSLADVGLLAASTSRGDL